MTVPELLFLVLAVMIMVSGRAFAAGPGRHRKAGLATPWRSQATRRSERAERTEARAEARDVKARRQLAVAYL
jgi:hypothetical protein